MVSGLSQVCLLGFLYDKGDKQAPPEGNSSHTEMGV